MEQTFSSAPLWSRVTHAANIEVASDRSNHDCLLAAARLTRSGGSFHRMDLLLGTLRRHVSTLTTVPTSLGSARPFATLGLRNSRRSTHTCQITNLSTFSARFVRVRAVGRSVISVSAPGTCLLSLIVKFASSFRSLATLACFRLAHCSNVHRCRLWTEQRQSHEEESQPLRLGSLSTFSVCRHASANGFSTVIQAI